MSTTTTASTYDIDALRDHVLRYGGPSVPVTPEDRSELAELLTLYVSGIGEEISNALSTDGAKVLDVLQESGFESAVWTLEHLVEKRDTFAICGHTVCTLEVVREEWTPSVEIDARLLDEAIDRGADEDTIAMHRSDLANSQASVAAIDRVLAAGAQGLTQADA